MLSSVMLTLILPNKFVLFQYFTGKGLGNKEIKKKSEEEKTENIRVFNQYFILQLAVHVLY